MNTWGAACVIRQNVFMGWQQTQWKCEHSQRHLQKTRPDGTGQKTHRLGSYICMISCFCLTSLGYRRFSRAFAWKKTNKRKGFIQRNLSARRPRVNRLKILSIWVRWQFMVNMWLFLFIFLFLLLLRNLPCVSTLVKTFPNKSQVKQQWQHGLTGWFIWVSPEKNNCFIWVWLCKIFTNSSVERGKELWRGSGRNEQVNCWFYHNVNKATENAVQVRQIKLSHFQLVTTGLTR